MAQPALPVSPSELASRLDQVLAAAEKLVAGVPDEHVDRTTPGEGISVRDLAYRLFRHALAFADGMDLGRVSPAWLDERTPEALTDGPAIARYGALVRGRLAGWFEGAAPGEYARTIETPVGHQSGRDLLARTTRDAVRHLRQLYALLRDVGVAPTDSLTAADIESLSLHENLC